MTIDKDGNNKLDMVVGNSSGNVACIKDDGMLLWEYEAHDSIMAGDHFGDVSGDGLVEIVMVTKKGSVWVTWAKQLHSGKLYVSSANYC